jgi:hypothetical protein
MTPTLYWTIDVAFGEFLHLVHKIEGSLCGSEYFSGVKLSFKDDVTYETFCGLSYSLPSYGDLSDSVDHVFSRAWSAGCVIIPGSSICGFL